MNNINKINNIFNETSIMATIAYIKMQNYHHLYSISSSIMPIILYHLIFLITPKIKTIKIKKCKTPIIPNLSFPPIPSNHSPKIPTPPFHPPLLLLPYPHKPT